MKYRATLLGLLVTDPAHPPKSVSILSNSLDDVKAWSALQLDGKKNCQVIVESREWKQVLVIESEG